MHFEKLRQTSSVDGTKPLVFDVYYKPAGRKSTSAPEIRVLSVTKGHFVQVVVGPSLKMATTGETH